MPDDDPRDDDALWEAANRVALGTGVKRFGDPRKPDRGNWQLLPPAPGVCSQCAVEHEPHEPHVLSFYFQYAFFAEHDRWPTWTDALAHCDDEMYEIAREVLAEHDIEVPERL